ncbi:MAG: ribosome maturation factor RimM [Clostridiales bacterium]|nr:ribosome maturation factor RimM [Clostridiales bacterium]
MQKEFLEIGKIVAPHGIKGEVKAECWCDSPSVLCEIKNILTKDGAEKLTVERARPNSKNQAVIKFKGYNTADEAESLRSKVLIASRNDIPKDENSFFIQDIIGMTVCDNSTPDKIYGKITDVFSTGANDVYEITNENGKKYLIPVIDDVVKEISIDTNTVLIYPMKGLFDDDN